MKQNSGRFQSNRDSSIVFNFSFSVNTWDQLVCFAGFFFSSINVLLKLTD
jgi:hypothetical protein